MKLSAAVILSLVLILHAGAQTKIFPGEMLQVNFQFNRQPVDQHFGPSDPTPDRLWFSIVGQRAFSANSTSYQIYDGDTLLSAVDHRGDLSWFVLNYFSSTNPYPYFTGIRANQIIVFSGIVDGNSDGRIAYVPHFTAPSEDHALNIFFSLVLGKQGGIIGYKAFTDKVVSCSVVPVPEPTAGCLILATVAYFAIRLMVIGLTHKLKTAADLTGGRFAQTARPTRFSFVVAFAHVAGVGP